MTGCRLVVAAGRSGRDYPTLAAAAAGLPCRADDHLQRRGRLGRRLPSGRVEVLTATFGRDYLLRLLRADVVAVPLAVEDISAGQMVLVQAMALGRPLVVTRTPTIGDYLRDGETALLVPRGDVAAMAAALRQLLDDPAAALAMGRRAQAEYAARFSNEAHLRLLAEAVVRHCRGGDA